MMVQSQTPIYRLGDLVHIRTGKLDANACSDDGEYPFFTCSENPLRISTFSYDCECVLVAGNGELNIKYYQGKFDAYQRTYIIESLNKSNLSVRYLYHFMSVYVEKLRNMSIGGIIKYIKLGFLTEAKIPLPPMSEQHHIADILDRADALRAKRSVTLARLDELTQAIFVEMFGNPCRKGTTGRNPTTPRSLGDMTRIRTGKLDANAAHENGAHPFFTCAVEPLRINTPAFDTKAVLVAGNGDLNVKYFEGKFNAYQRTYVIESTDETVLLPRFLYAFLDLYVGELRKQSIGGVIKYIKLPYLTDAVVPLPDIRDQYTFVDQLKSVERLKNKHASSRSEMEILFRSIQDRAFGGTLLS